MQTISIRIMTRSFLRGFISQVMVPSGSRQAAKYWKKADLYWNLCCLVGIKYSYIKCYFQHHGCRYFKRKSVNCLPPYFGEVPVFRTGILVFKCTFFICTFLYIPILYFSYILIKYFAICPITKYLIRKVFTFGEYMK